jgi:hypothetical protein
MLIDRDTLYSFCDELRAARRARRLVQVSVVRLMREKQAVERENVRLREELKKFVRGTGYKYTEGGN